MSSFQSFTINSIILCYSLNSVFRIYSTSLCLPPLHSCFFAFVSPFSYFMYFLFLSFLNKIFFLSYLWGIFSHFFPSFIHSLLVYLCSQWKLASSEALHIRILELHFVYELCFSFVTYFDQIYACQLFSLLSAFMLNWLYTFPFEFLVTTVQFFRSVQTSVC